MFVTTKSQSHMSLLKPQEWAVEKPQEWGDVIYTNSTRKGKVTVFKTNLINTSEGVEFYITHKYWVLCPLAKRLLSSGQYLFKSYIICNFNCQILFNVAKYC